MAGVCRVVGPGPASQFRHLDGRLVELGGYSKEQFGPIKKADVHTYLAGQYPDVFAPDFD
jgi:hypothetical protein